MSASARDHDRWADSLGAWLLGALPDDEAREFAAHLEECPVCGQDAASLRVAADALPASAPSLPAPPELKARIMAVAEREAQLLAAAGEGADQAEAAPRPARGRLRRLSLRPALVLPVTLALLVIGGVAGLLGEQLLHDDARTVSARLDPSVAVPGARADLEIREDRAVLVARRLPAPPQGRVYQVWLDRGGSTPEPTSALFTTRGDGSASVAVPGSLRGVRQILVTDEPTGGSTLPTRRPIISVTPA
ncbi:MAG TPA: anti-sigma factor [Solirubrobacteraceae bacterium]|nr:anti-sigma factor [Solirubrobacteraceae bacterium]